MNRFLIWSLEHRAWWRANSAGYTRNQADAGEYSLEEAAAICRDANATIRNVPMEAMVPVDHRCAASGG